MPPLSHSCLIRVHVDAVRLRLENKMAAPAKKVSMKKSQRDKLAAAAAAAASQAPSMAAAAADKAAAKLVPVAPKCGVRFVSLGLSPMHQVDDSHFTHSKELHNTFNRMFKTGAAFYPFKVSTHLGHGCELQPPPGTVWLYHCKSQLWMIKFEE